MLRVQMVRVMLYMDLFSLFLCTYYVESGTLSQVSREYKHLLLITRNGPNLGKLFGKKISIGARPTHGITRFLKYLWERLIII